MSKETRTTVTAKMTAHEMLSLNELIRMESMEVQKVQAMMPMISDPELRGEFSSCTQTAKNHLKALVGVAQPSTQAPQ